MTGGRPLVVAHRAGNDLGMLRAAEALGVDMIESDLHLFRGRIEVRHEKTIGPIPILWERWRLVRPFSPRLRLMDLLAAVAPTTHLMLDLKGPSSGLSRAALDVLQRSFAGRSYTVCARNWMLLRPFEGIPGVRVIRSIAGPLQLQCLLHGHRRRLDGVSVDQGLLDARSTARLLDRTGFVLAWGVTADERLRALCSLGVSGFILEEPTLLRSVLNDPGGVSATKPTNPNDSAPKQSRQ